MTMGSSWLFGATPDDADAVVHSPADGAGHLGAVRITAAAGRAARVELAALRVRAARADLER